MTGLVRLLREHEESIEASLAMLPSAVDLRDLWRPGSGLTLRRLWVLIKHLPADAPFRRSWAAAQKAAEIPSDQRLRERTAHWERQKAQRAARGEPATDAD